jgi:Ca-activated chloride channel family protein
VIADLSNLVTWGAPLWLGALALLPVLAALFAWGERRRSTLLQRLVAARLQPELAGSVSLGKRRLQFALTLGALACFALALAQPRHGYTVEESKRKGRDVLFVVDTSRSMLATDVAPNRLERAKFAAQDLANALEGDRLGLIAFAGSAFLQAPLTVDYTAVFAALNELDTNVIPLGGTNIAEAIRSATLAFGKSEGESHALVLFTDGEDLDQGALDAARKAAATMRIFTVGVGSADGSLIPVPDENGGTQFIKDSNGQFVKSRLDEKMLTDIAEATGGFYTRLQNGPADMKRIVDAGLGKLKEGEIDARFSHRPIERYQWPLGLGIALLALSLLINDRRNRTRGAGALALLLTLAAWTPRAALAETGVELYNRNHYEEARQKFDYDLKRRPNSPDLHFNKGTAQYQLGDYENAITEFSNALSSSDPQLRGKSEYNLGTTLLQRALKKENDPKRDTDLKNAQQHLEEAIKESPQIAPPARKNLEIVKKELAKPKPTPPPKQDQKQDDKKDDKKDNKDQQSKDQQSKDQQSKDQQSKDQQSKDQQSKDQQSKDQQSKDQQSKDQQSKDQQSKDQQSKDQQSKDQQSKDQQSKDQQGQQPQGQPSPTPAPGEDEKKLSGEIKPNDSKPEEKPDGQAEVPVKPGEMSPNQAQAVLDSLKGEDEQPFKSEQRSEAPVLKDW